MKRWHWILPLLVSLVLAGCAAAPPEANDSAELMPAAAPAAAVQTAPPLTAERTEAQARPLTNEEILAAYSRAVTAYGWFDLAALPIAGPETAVDGWAYYRVDYPAIENMDDLRGYLRGLFSESVTEELLLTGGAHPLYQELDGVLYTTAGARGADIYRGTITTQVARVDETAYSVNVTVETLDRDLTTVTGLECWSFPYKWEGDRWVFTDFTLVY